jgi:APA family basic amino acid/polyamine antiporter
VQVQPLRRVLGTWAVVAFGVTNEIAAGLFFVSTQIQQTVPGVGDLVPWLMLAGGALTLLTVVAYRYFFASGLIGAGGEYVILRDVLGARWGFLATFLAWFGVTGSLGTLSYVAPKFLANACSSIGWTQAAALLSSTPGTLVCGLVLLWTVWLIHVRGVRFAALLTVAAMIFVITVAVTIIAYGFATTPEHFGLALGARLHLSAQSLMQNAPQTHTLGAIASALPLLFYGYLGLSTATQTGGEAVDAQRSLARGVLIAVLLVTFIYTLFSFAVYHAVPWQVVPALSVRGLTTYTTSTGLLGLVMPPWLSSLMNVFVAVIVVKTFLPAFLAQSRWIYAWGVDNIIPERFAGTHAKFQTPVVALTVSAVLASLSLFESTIIGYVFGVNMRVLSVMIVFFLLGLGLIVFPYTAPALYRSNTSAIRNNRTAQIAVGSAIMLFTAWFTVSIIYGGRAQAPWLQPAVQAAAVAIIGLLIVRTANRRRAAAAAAPDTARPRISDPSLY